MKTSWHSSIDSLFKSKASKTAQKLSSFNIQTLYDLIWIIPRRISKIQHTLDINSRDSEFVHLNVKIISRQISNGKPVRGKPSLKNITLTVQDIESKHFIQIKWFNTYPSQLKKISDSEYLNIFGKISEFNGAFQLINPELNAKKSNNNLYIEYPTINTISGTKIRSLIDKIPSDLWDNVPSIIPNTLSPEISLPTAFKMIHGRTGLSKQNIAINRLIYEELFLEQVLLYERRKLREKLKQDSIDIDINREVELFKKVIPFELTDDQNHALQNILHDLKSTSAMMRLLQGDVGCGKTIVAFGAAKIMSKQNLQSAMMCPTEALAQQHLRSAYCIFKKNEVCLLTSSTKPKEKKELLKGIKNGSYKLIIGTHSLIQDSVEFKNLSLTIIDEQHKFGVNQRISLTKKSTRSNTLLMTATPIPRSLCLTHFGDLEISIIRQKPDGRKNVSSRIINKAKFNQFLNFLNTRISMGEQIYVVAPAIEESEYHDIQNITEIFNFFKRNFPSLNIEYLHGKLTADAKDKILLEFYQQKVEILVSTSVIEVGIDNHNATVMCIFGPERFGLSSLHQLRGRVGRGGKPGFFFMVEDRNLNEQSTARLKVIENCNDGFIIAEEDLKIRGEGNIVGTEQSGVAQRKISDLTQHQDILNKAIKDFNSCEEKEILFNTKLIKQENILTI